MKNRKYSEEFKKQAIELADSLGSTAKAAAQLGIPGVTIHAWRKRLKEGIVESSPFDEKEALQEEIKRLKLKTTEQEKVIHILKKAAAFFSQDQLK